MNLNQNYKRFCRNGKYSLFFLPTGVCNSQNTKWNIIPEGFRRVPCVDVYMLQANSCSVCRHSGATSTLFWHTGSNQPEPQLQHAKQRNRASSGSSTLPVPQHTQAPKMMLMLLMIYGEWGGTGWSRWWQSCRAVVQQMAFSFPGPWRSHHGKGFTSDGNVKAELTSRPEEATETGGGESGVGSMVGSSRRGNLAPLTTRVLLLSGAGALGWH